MNKIFKEDFFDMKLDKLEFNKIEYINGDKYENIYAVGDPHGCYDLLMKKLKEIGFNFSKDLLISVGDNIDKGKQNEEMLLLLNKKWFKSVRGNHEQYSYETYVDPSVKEKHIGKSHGGLWLYKNNNEEMRKYIALKCYSLPLMIELQYKGSKYAFLHADPVYDNIDAIKRGIESNEMVGEKTFEYACITNRVMAKRKHDVPYIRGVSRVYLGHQPFSKIQVKGNCHFIDTGAVYNGNLTIVKVGAR